MKNISIILNLGGALAAVALFSGCQSGPTHKQGFDFGRYHTFAVLPIVANGTYTDPGIVTRLGSSVQDTVVDKLSAKGFKQINESEADFLVSMKFDFWPGSTDTGVSDQHVTYEDRLFDLQIIDKQSKAVVWSNYIRRKTDKTLPDAVVRQRVADLLKPFPPGAK
jgi:hypothetical protein